jgi:hypothetical protein
MWDNGLKRGWVGPNRCVLCKSDVEYVSHLFVLCPYAGHVTSIIKDKLNSNMEWNRGNLEDFLRKWFMDRLISLYAGLPSFLVSNLWWDAG